MTFEEMYPQPVRTDLGPHPDLYPDPVKYPELVKDNGYYPCDCGVLTGFRAFVDDGIAVDGVSTYYVHVCSPECYEKVTPAADPQEAACESLLAILKAKSNPGGTNEPQAGRESTEGAAPHGSDQGPERGGSGSEAPAPAVHERGPEAQGAEPRERPQGEAEQHEAGGAVPR